MIKGLYEASRSLDQKMKNIDVIANNLANLNTVGYKRELPFAEILNSMGEVRIRKASSHQQGEVLQTSNPLDLAISGTGFFAVKDKEGTVALTRDGRFRVSEEGNLVDSSGNNVMGQNGPITMEEVLQNKNSVITVNKNGEIKIGDRTIDTLQILKVDDPTQLDRASDSSFSTGEQNPFPAQEGEFGISQGFVEEANTNPIVEMEAMISLNKSYETTQKVMSSLDLSLGQANEIGKF